MRRGGGWGRGTRSALLALLRGCGRGTMPGLSGAANVSTHWVLCLSPQSHTKVTVSRSTPAAQGACGLSDASGFHTCEECPGSLPSSRVCLEDVYFGKVVQCRSSATGQLLPCLQGTHGGPQGHREALSSLCGPKLLAPCMEAACKGLTGNLGCSQRLLLTLEERTLWFPIPISVRSPEHPAYQGLACLYALTNPISWCFPPTGHPCKLQQG